MERRVGTSASIQQKDRRLLPVCRFSLGFVTDSAEPFTADDLDAVVEAMWTYLPWEPNTIKLTPTNISLNGSALTVLPGG